MAFGISLNVRMEMCQAFYISIPFSTNLHKFSCLGFYLLNVLLPILESSALRAGEWMKLFIKRPKRLMNEICLSNMKGIAFKIHKRATTTVMLELTHSLFRLGLPLQWLLNFREIALFFLASKPVVDKSYLLFYVLLIVFLKLLTFFFILQ